MINVKYNWFKIWLLVLGFCLTGGFADAQAQTLSSLNYPSYLEHVHVEEGMDFTQALERVESRFNVFFMYRTDAVEGKKVIRSMFLAANLENALEELLKGHELALKRINPKTYAIYSTEEAVQKNEILPVFQQVSGEVSDANTGESLPGVNVVVKGTSTGMATDSEGRYALGASSPSDTLVFSFIGYETQEVAINGRSSIDVQLQSQAISGQEMVVTAFGMERERRSLSYSTQGVDTEQLTTARETNVINSLQGKVAGLTINQGGDGVGSPSRVVLRGNRSISGDSSPLYVVDGVPIRGNPETLSPDNIASINVLKGPNAAALYGSEAQNGAILIETKKGQAGVVEVSLNNTLMFSQPIHSIELQNEYGQGIGGNYVPTAAYSWGPRMEGQMVDHWSQSPQLAGTQYAFNPQPDNIRDWYQTGHNLSNNINVSAGSESIQSVFSYTYTDANGTVPGNSMQRHNASLRLSSQLTDRLAIDSNFGYMGQGIDGPVRESPHHLESLYALPRSVSTEQMRNFEYLDVDGSIRQNFWDVGHNNLKNPYWITNRMLNTRSDDRVRGMASLTYDFTEAISLMVRSSFDGRWGESELKWSNDSYNDAPFGMYGIGESHSSQWNGDARFSYTEDLSENWNVDTNVGAVIKRERNGGLTANTGPGLTAPNFFALSNAQQLNVNHNVGSPRDIQSLFATGTIGWKDAIYLDITARNDWSSTLPEDNRSYFYPSVGLAAVLSDLIPSFPELFTNARVRASWAQVGSDTQAYQLTRAVNITMGGRDGYVDLTGTLPNENLRPEQTEAFEVGLDLHFLDGRLEFNATAYKENTTDQLFSINLPVGSGASSFFTNGGNIENKGVELLLSSTPVQTRDFIWNTSVIFAHNETMVLEINDDRPRIRTGNFVIEQGEPWGNIYGRSFERDDQGRILVADSGIPRYTASDDTKIANAQADWDGSLSNSFSYRNFGVSFLIEHRQGGNVISGLESGLAGNGSLKSTLQGREGGLIFGENIFSDETAVKEDGTPNDIPINAQQLWTSLQAGHTILDEAFVHDATNTRLRELTIGYSLPQSFTSRLGVSNVSVSLVARNLFFLYRASDFIDPSIGNGTGLASGVGGNEVYPHLTERSFGTSIKMDF
ncbi:MAG: SusC/RagA family TonB-linked outer membrane protein [Balneolaceae bacterium]